MSTLCNWITAAFYCCSQRVWPSVHVFCFGTPEFELMYLLLLCSNSASIIFVGKTLRESETIWRILQVLASIG